MARTHGAVNYTTDQIRFIQNNWKLMSDKTISKRINIPIGSVQKFRVRYNLNRYQYRIADNKTKALICELYIAGNTAIEIGGIVGKGVGLVYTTISKCLFSKRLDETTKVITLKSKI